MLVSLDASISIQMVTHIFLLVLHLYPQCTGALYIIPLTVQWWEEATV